METKTETNQRSNGETNKKTEHTCKRDGTARRRAGVWAPCTRTPPRGGRGVLTSIHKFCSSTTYSRWVAFYWVFASYLSNLKLYIRNKRRYVTAHVSFMYVPVT